MGYVMQEPTLFNYTIKENVLHGNSIAKDSEIKEAIAIANAAEFIDANSFSNSFEDSALSLYQAFKERESIITESKSS
jgi:ABC-type multidrug transport system fused ATPase/permease subunit